VGLLLRTPVAVAIAIAAALLVIAESLGIADLFTPALIAWALCIVLAARSAARKRRWPAVAYVLGALPGTLALAFLVWLTAS
jgi:hypothetical protein